MTSDIGLCLSQKIYLVFYRNLMLDKSKGHQKKGTQMS